MRRSRADRSEVRTGPNYSAQKKKAPSGPALYECVAVDLVKSADPLRKVRRSARGCAVWFSGRRNKASALFKFGRDCECLYGSIYEAVMFPDGFRRLSR